MSSGARTEREGPAAPLEEGTYAPWTLVPEEVGDERKWVALVVLTEVGKLELQAELVVVLHGLHEHQRLRARYNQLERCVDV